MDALKIALLLAFIASVLFIHFRGKARLPFLRQLVNHSAWFAPYNALMYLFSKPSPTPYLERRDFPELDVLRDNWEVFRDEAKNLMDEGFIRDALNNNEAGFGSFFKKGWKRFYLTWYDKPLPSAVHLCPRSVELISKVPEVKGAMFALLPGNSHLNPHRDPYAGSLRYHLGLSTPNSDNCRIYVDGEPYAWRDGEDVIFDETFVHWVKNETNQTRVILFCDIERPLRSRLLTRINRWLSSVLGHATAPQNIANEPVGSINRAYSHLIRIGNWFGGHIRRFKRANPKGYKSMRIALAIGIALLVYRWLV